MSKEKKPASLDDRKGSNVTPKPEEKPTGAGAEATEGMDGEAKGASHEHRSGYGGNGGVPKLPNA